MLDIETLWDFGDPEGTEAIFRSLLAEASEVEKAILWTQIARTFSLRKRFDEARAALENVGREDPEARTRFELETGRIYNSSGQPDEAVPHFRSAMEIAKTAGLDYLYLDSLHMLAIADEPNVIEWAERGIEAAKTASEEKCRRWLGPFYNNLGWTYFDRGQYDKALELFELGLEERERQGVPRPIEIAKEAVAEAKKALGR
ncbi:MAG: tetratricopeptide repeat protein [Chthonomonas sp.]|nr:tetratricopeptide repeat protein [Chthonomonas sp.]